MTLLQSIVDTICHALATSGPASWEGEGEMISDPREIPTKRLGGADGIVTIGRLPEPFRMRIDGTARAMSLAQFKSEFSSSVTLAELALISRLDEAGRLRAGKPMKRVAPTVMSRTH